MRLQTEISSKARVEEVCREIAEKLEDPHALIYLQEKELALGKNTDEDWTEMKLSSGLSGLILFFGAYHELNPDQGWDEVAHHYLKICVEKAQTEEFLGVSLHAGLTGLCYAAYVCSQNGQRYQNLLAKLDALLLEQLESTFPQIADKFFLLDDDVPPVFYNLSSGVSGILLYLLIRKDNPEFFRLASNCIYILVRLLSRKREVSGQLLPGWFVHPKYQYPHQEKIFPSGNFPLSMTDGICGCLAVLSLALMHGISVSGQYELIQEMSHWLIDHGIKTDKGTSWPYALDVNADNSSLEITQDLFQDAWYVGTPAVSRTLYLAGKATYSHAICHFAEESFLKVFSKTWQEWKLMGTSVVWGRAGLLALTTLMARDTGNVQIRQQVDVLVADLLRFYDVKHLFGFQTIRVSEENELRWFDHPGFLDGASGIALSLLMTNAEKNSNWQWLFI